MCKEWVDGLAAISTFAAAAIALCFGQQGIRLERERRKADEVQKLVAARLYAMSIKAQVAHSKRVMVDCVAMLSIESRNMTTEEHHIQALLQVREWLLADTFLPSPDGMLSLTNLGGALAEKVAKAYDHLQLIRLRAKALPDSAFDMGQRAPVFRAAEVKTWRDNLNAAQNLLHFVQLEFEKIVVGDLG